MMPDNQSTADRGRRLVIAELQERGVAASVVRKGKLVLLEIRSPRDGRRIHLRVKTRTSGTWQGSTRDGDPDPPAQHPEVYWVFVEVESGSLPGFFIVPDQEMRKDIHKAHEEYLRRHGGGRAVTADSTHHAIQPERIKRWRGKWDLLGM